VQNQGHTCERVKKGIKSLDKVSGAIMAASDLAQQVRAD
jgi:hypothetical protein